MFRLNPVNPREKRFIPTVTWKDEDGIVGVAQVAEPTDLRKVDMGVEPSLLRRVATPTDKTEEEKTEGMAELGDTEVTKVVDGKKYRKIIRD